MNVSVYRPVSRSRVWLHGVIVGRPSAERERMPRRTFTVLALGVAILLVCSLQGAFSAAAAQAEAPKLVPYGSFVSEGPGVAVDQASGDIFTAGFFDVEELKLTHETFRKSYGHIEKLDAEGKRLSTFGKSFGEGENEGWPFAGTAVNPVNGNLYVLEALSFETFAPGIAVYEPSTGKLIRSFSVASDRNVGGFYSILPIATDSSGNVYVAGENDILEYSEAGTLLKSFTGSGAGALKEPTGVAIDSSGNLWVADSANNRIVELDSSGALVEVNGKPVEIESEGVLSVALDGHGDVFALVANNADPCGALGSSCVHLIEYSSEGRQLADIGAGSFGNQYDTTAINSLFSMVAVNEASGRVYVSDTEKHTVWVFGSPTAPVVDRELTAEIGVSEAKLGALVNPGGIRTSYRFEYGTTAAYGSSTPFPEGSVEEGVQAHAVWASASGLAAGTIYHYRVVATNELGTVYGPEQTFTTATAAEAACPNEQLRGGLSASLPDCRAYELVTPPVKSSSDFDEAQFEYSSMAAADGEALTLITQEPYPGAPTGGYYYVTTRAPSGWLAEDIMPIESYDGLICQNYKAVYAYSEQLTKDVIETGGGSSASVTNNQHEDSESCNPEGHRVVSGEPVGHENLLVRDNATGTYQLVNVTPPGVTPADTHFKAASADLSHVIFTETSPLAKGARYGVENLYEWDEGALRLVSVLPDGTAVPGSLAAEHEDVVSSDGSHVLFTYGGALYDRIDGQRTVQIDEKQGVSGPSGGGSFKAATSDGSKVFFLDESKLTPGSTAAAGEPDLYECALPKGASKCELTDLTVAAAGEHADVLTVTPLGSKDSSDVYFTAEGVLAANKREYTDAEGKKVVEEAKRGENNLYLDRDGTTTFIATFTPESEEGDGEISPDGTWYAFGSRKSLTGYDNVKPNKELAGELFLYSAASGQLVCASCSPTGESPVEAGGAAARSGRHLLTDAGQVFFETYEALVPSDTNGQVDVYEYENGQPSLISSGTSSSESILEDASESGDDVFFRSSQALVAQDNQEGQVVIYDARVGGGFPSASSPPLCTTAEACREAPSPQPSIYGAPSSATFSGVGNLTPPAPASAVKPRELTRAQKLKDALKACKKDKSKSKRAKCEETAHKKYGAAKKSTTKRSSNDRRAK